MQQLSDRDAQGEIWERFVLEPRTQTYLGMQNSRYRELAIRKLGAAIFLTQKEDGLNELSTQRLFSHVQFFKSELEYSIPSSNNKMHLIALLGPANAMHKIAFDLAFHYHSITPERALTQLYLQFELLYHTAMERELPGAKQARFSFIELDGRILGIPEPTLEKVAEAMNSLLIDRTQKKRQEGLGIEKCPADIEAVCRLPKSRLLLTMQRDPKHAEPSIQAFSIPVYDTASAKAIYPTVYAALCNAKLITPGTKVGCLFSIGNLREKRLSLMRSGIHSISVINKAFMENAALEGCELLFGVSREGTYYNHSEKANRRLGWIPTDIVVNSSDGTPYRVGIQTVDKNIEPYRSIDAGNELHFIAPWGSDNEPQTYLGNAEAERIAGKMLRAEDIRYEFVVGEGTYLWLYTRDNKFPFAVRQNAPCSNSWSAFIANEKISGTLEEILPLACKYLWSIY